MSTTHVKSLSELEMRMGRKIRLGIVEDHEMFREGMQLLLSSISSIEMIGSFSTSDDLKKYLIHKQPDLLLMDIKLNEESGIDLTEFVTKQYPEVKVIALSMYDTPNIILKMISSGASGYLLKNVSKDELKEAITKVMQGQEYYCSEAAMQVMQKVAHTDRNVSVPGLDLKGFTLRELQVIKLVCDGKTNKEISDNLNISTRTVETHRLRIMKKMGVNSSTELVKYAIRHELYNMS